MAVPLSERKRKFLIVENDPNDAFLIRRALAATTLFESSVICRNPSEAKAMLRGAGMYRNRTRYPWPDLILTDMRIENESGLELVEWLRQQPPPLGQLPVFILSGSCTPLQVDAATKVGANGVFRKPTRLDDLQALIAKIAEQSFSNPPSSSGNLTKGTPQP